jgi:hypothetical protein
MWPTHCDRLQFLKKKWEISTVQEHSGARLASSTNHLLLLLALRKPPRLSHDSADNAINSVIAGRALSSQSTVEISRLRSLCTEAILSGVQASLRLALQSGYK